MAKQFTLVDAISYATTHEEAYGYTLEHIERLLRAAYNNTLGPLQTAEVAQETLRVILWEEEDVDGFEYVDLEDTDTDLGKGISHFSFVVERTADGVQFQGTGRRTPDDRYFGRPGQYASPNDLITLTEYRQ